MGTFRQGDCGDVKRRRMRPKEMVLVVFFGGVFGGSRSGYWGRAVLCQYWVHFLWSKANGQAGKFEFEVASVRLNEKWKFADPRLFARFGRCYVPTKSVHRGRPLSTFIGLLTSWICCTQ